MVCEVIVEVMRDVAVCARGVHPRSMAAFGFLGLAGVGLIATAVSANTCELEVPPSCIIACVVGGDPNKASSPSETPLLFVCSHERDFLAEVFIKGLSMREARPDMLSSILVNFSVTEFIVLNIMSIIFS